MANTITWKARPVDKNGRPYIARLKNPKRHHFQGQHSLSNSQLFSSVLGRDLRARIGDGFYTDEPLPVGVILGRIGNGFMVQVCVSLEATQ